MLEKEAKQVNKCIYNNCRTYELNNIHDKNGIMLMCKTRLINYIAFVKRRFQSFLLTDLRFIYINSPFLNSIHGNQQLYDL